MECGEKWRSVRKVRYMEDIETAVNYSTKYQGQEFSGSTFAQLLVQGRMERQNLVQKHNEREISRTKKSLYQTHFGITLPDTLTFLKEIQVFSTQNGFVTPLRLSNEIQKASNEREKRKLILSYVLNSKYRTYRCLLRRLGEVQEFVISRCYFKRDRDATSFLVKNGFLTDVVSFYASRDLLYELDILNWCMSDEGLMVYSTGVFGEQKENSFSEHINVHDSVLSFRKKFNNKVFVDELIETYLNLTGRRFMVNADLIQLRDIFCRKYRIGDFYFKELLLKAVTENSSHKILLNFGTISKRKTNYDLKITSLPKLYSDRLALYIAIEERT